MKQSVEPVSTRVTMVTKGIKSEVKEFGLERVDAFVEKMSCLTEMSPVGNRIRLENGEVVFKSGNAEISCRNK